MKEPPAKPGEGEARGETRQSGGRQAAGAKQNLDLSKQRSISLDAETIAKREHLSVTLLICQWLIDDAAESDCTWKVLSIHQPPYYTNATGGSVMTNGRSSSASKVGICISVALRETVSSRNSTWPRICTMASTASSAAAAS